MVPRAAASLPSSSLSFITDVCVAPRRLPTQRRSHANASPLRRPRHPPLSPLSHATLPRHRATPRAVFLPPEGLPPVPDDDFDDDDTDADMSIFDDPPGLDEDDDSEAYAKSDSERDLTNFSTTRPSSSGASGNSTNASRASSGGGGGTYTPRVDTIHRLIAETEPQYETWQSRQASRSLTTLRGSSEALLGADELNDSLRPTHLQRHRHVLAPDEAFGAIFTWDVLVANARELEQQCWMAVASERGLSPPDMDDIVRAELMAPEAAVSRVFYWTRDWGEIKATVFRKSEILATLEPAFQWRAASGVHAFLAALGRHGVKCILCAEGRPRALVEPVVSKLGLDEFFSKNEIVSTDDEFDSLEQMLLVAALKSERPPGKCAVFTDKPATITAGHEVTSKVVGVIGTHAAYEMRTADHIVSGFEDLVVYNIRRLFSEEGNELMDPQTMRDENEK